MVPFLKCYFESEHYPVEIFDASEQCIAQLSSDETLWFDVIMCAASNETFNYFVNDNIYSKSIRPLFDKTPRIFINFAYSALGAVDLKKALCRENVSYHWL